MTLAAAVAADLDPPFALDLDPDSTTGYEIVYILMGAEQGQIMVST